MVSLSTYFTLKQRTKNLKMMVCVPSLRGGEKNTVVQVMAASARRLAKHKKFLKVLVEEGLQCLLVLHKII